VVAALTILKAYHNAGLPSRPSPPLQSFTHWSDKSNPTDIRQWRADACGNRANRSKKAETILCGKEMAGHDVLARGQPNRDTSSPLASRRS
jgi:hypothetical protein